MFEGGFAVSQLSENAVTVLDATQAVELLRVMEQQAHWENLKENSAKEMPTAQLKDRQKAYEAYRSRLAAYTTKYRTFPLPELTQNSPKWVAQWFRVVQAVLRGASQNSSVETPVNLVAKAQRLGVRIAERLKRSPLEFAAPPANIEGVIAHVEAWIGWCGASINSVPNALVESEQQPKAA